MVNEPFRLCLLLAFMCKTWTVNLAELQSLFYPAENRRCIFKLAVYSTVKYKYEAIYTQNQVKRKYVVTTDR